VTKRRAMSAGPAASAVWLPCAIAMLIGCSWTAIPIGCTLPGPLSQKRMAELWVRPEPGRDLLHGVGGKRLAPDPAVRYTVLDIKRSGYSRGYTVTDASHREWSVKFPPEAGPEVAASRILWAVGYHQPPIYYLAEWNAGNAPSTNPQLPARFRERAPALHGLDAGGDWSYDQNPFVGTHELNGLLVLQAMLGNSDLKAPQNVIYTLDDVFEGAKRWYVARDLGQTFGRTGVFDAPRGDLEVFEQTPFITGVAGGKVRFDYRGRHHVLFENITPEDVRWICTRLSRLTEEQWQDAFRAGGFARSDATRFIRRMKQKVAEGLALKE
jgi:hypothetical protein